jgi:membrane-associated phospholipid phosphatase
VVAYLGYALFPAMPPWMAGQAGYLPQVTRIIPLVWDRLGVHSAAALFTRGSEFANPIAAMPSLHAAYPMLLLLFFWRAARRWVRVVLVAYVLAMAFALVYTGEHFVIDELAGWCCAIAVYFAGSRLFSWRQAAGLRRVTREGPVLARAGR